MSIMDDFMDSIVGKLFCFLCLVFAAIPLALAFPYFVVTFTYELINSIENPLYRDLAYAAVFETCVIIFVVKTTYINWFRKHLWRLPEIKKEEGIDE